MSQLLIPLFIVAGIELIKHLKDKSSNLPILATGQCQYTEESVKTLGAAGMIQKPFTMNELTQKVQQIIIENYLT